MNRALGHFCAHTGYIWAEELPEDGEMTLPSRHRIMSVVKCVSDQFTGASTNQTQLI